MRPQSPIAEKFPGSDEIAQEKLMDQVKWQEFFKSPDLQKIIETALENNRDLRVAALNIDAARALYRISQSDLLPTINAEGSLTKQKTPANASITGATTTTSKYSANLASTAFEVDLFGRVRSQNKSALETFFATKEAKNATQIALVAETANAYLQLLADREILELAEDNLTAQEKSSKLINKKFEYGIISKLGATQFSGLDNARSAKAIYTKKVAQDKTALLLLMGVASSDLLDKPGKLADIELMETLPTNLKSDVLLSRPDIMKAEHELKSANADIGAARAAFFPSISLTGSVGYASSDLSKLFSKGSGGAWSFAPQITMPIFAGGSNIATLNYAKVSKNIYIARYEKSIQTAFKEVSDELSSYKSLKDQMEAENNLANAATDAHKMITARYEQGIDSFIDLANAKENLFFAKQSQIDLEKEQLSNLIQLYKVLGGGL